ncbi:flavin-dependent monooxygenase [Croceicoccus estronivorus]|uniref:flavin-dependent monooxygenase n=1 Tax=Croceicoccus estronivorus TaxID=1172626 RepID=UPI000835E6A8|nr:flavin-dependent monooxygenase [Croceicoccus estronivorus]OCC25605.1 flavin-dependent monooxygenase [Croceicoccus estronivorus]
MATSFAAAGNAPAMSVIDIEPCLDLIEKNGPVARKERKVPTGSVEALRESGVFRAFIPKRLGGIGATPQEWLRTLIKVAERDMSTAWITGVISVHAFQISLLDSQVQDEVYGTDLDERVSSSYNPVGARTKPVEGGVMLHGRWGWSSGSDHCQWALLGTIVEGRPLLQTMLVPRSAYVIEDTWHVMGLQGTGSNDIVIEEPIFVPDDHIHSQMDGYERLRDQPDAVYGLPWAQIFAATVAAPAIGAARHALRLFIAKAGGSSTDPTKLKGDPDILRRVAEASSLIDRAEANLIANFDSMMGLLESGQEIPLIDRARYRYETGAIVVQMMQAVDILFEVGGGRSVFLGSEIQNIWHDIHIARAHVANNPVPLARNYGNMLLGADNADFFL